jgi:mRNA interferase RelE/StbE
LAYNVEFDVKVLKQLKKIDKQVVLKILDGIDAFALNPQSKKIVKLKTPFDGAYRLRVGDYRVVFYQEDDLMLVSKIAHRKEVYL